LYLDEPEGLRRTTKTFWIIGVLIGIQTRHFLSTNQIQVAHISTGFTWRAFQNGNELLDSIKSWEIMKI
jgi:hypothetical protein